MLRNHLPFLILLVLLAACGTGSRKTKVLYYSANAAGSAAAQIDSIARRLGHEAVITSNPAYLQEDSLRQFSLLCLPFSALNTLDYRMVTDLKRYLEAGGGGLLAIRDSALQQRGYPWLQALENVNGPHQQNNSGVFVLQQGANDQALEGAMLAANGKGLPSAQRITTVAVPDTGRYTRTVLAQGLDEPMEMTMLPGGDVLLVERKGAVKLYDRKTKEIKTIANFNVFSGIEDGLLGVTPDPAFEKNHYLYFYYAVASEQPFNRLSRIELRDGNLVRGTEKALLEVPTQRRYCCHSAGYLKFDAKGLLYLSTGDNTNAEETDGYTPVDERPGRHLSDVQATAANTNDLRGKILRIKPEPDGSYSIPDGNLFPKNSRKGRPEIYVMGCRNPYRFSIDAHTGYLYWGDVGPDTKLRGDDGELMSYDEINQAKQPGFYGWPYFLGDNQAFPMYNYATKTLGPKKEAGAPLNLSPNNTGLRELPPAHPAMIWYGKNASRYFPLTGKGGASAMAGPIFYSDNFPDAPYRLSPYYNGKLLIYEWIRGWMMAVTFDEKGDYLRMEPFLPHIKFEAPVDVQFAPDGALYVLEYGSNWFSKNTNSKLVRIEFKEGNRNPVADIQADKVYGAAPLTVHLSAAASRDADPGDRLSYSWAVGDKALQEEKVTHTFSKPGVYNVALTVRDGKGGEGTAATQVSVGNTPPVVNIHTGANRSFYWDGAELDYRVEVKDEEDGAMQPELLQLSFGFLQQGKDAAVILAKGSMAGDMKFLAGQRLLNSLDCKACHAMSDASIGPAYTAIAARYAGNGDAVKLLAAKVIQGGSGNWGTRQMSAHPDMQQGDAMQIVQYILSLADAPAPLPSEGRLLLKDHIGKGTEGSYLLNAGYTDKGANGVPALTGRSHIVLRNPLVEAEDFDEGNVSIRTVTTEFLSYAAFIRNGNFMRYNQLDLHGVRHLRFRIQGLAGGRIEIHADKADGPLIGTATIPAGVAEWKEVVAPVQATPGQRPLYFIFKAGGDPDKPLLHLDRIYFDNK